MPLDGEYTSEYLESQGAEHAAAVSRTGARLVAVDGLLARRPGAGDLDAEVVDAPAIATLRLALHPLKLAGLVVASRHKLSTGRPG